MTSPFSEHSAISKLKQVNRETLGLQFCHALGLQFPNTFFKRSMISGGWVVTSLANFSSSSPPTGSNS
jgi:hypothetical protein